MAKGYWIGRVDVHNEEGYKAYAAANPDIFKKFGGRYVLRGGRFTGVEGQQPIAQCGDRIRRLRHGAHLLPVNQPEYEEQHQASATAPRSAISSSSKAMTAPRPDS